MDGMGTRMSDENHPQELCSGSEAGSYLRLIESVFHSTLGLRVIKKKKNHPQDRWGLRVQSDSCFIKIIYLQS